MKYTDSMKQFALTLYFYSPKAYNFLRTILYLPHNATIRAWMANYDCEVGFVTVVARR